MSKQRITLHFSTIHNLWSFVQEVRANSMEINTSRRTLTSDCNDADIALAKNKYGVRVENPQSLTN